VSTPDADTTTTTTDRPGLGGVAAPADGSATPGDDAGGGVDDAAPTPGLSWGKALVLAAALAFLGFAFGVFVSRDTSPGGGSVDVGFYRDMVTHHQQALSLATLELAHGENSTARSYAREVLTFQSYEVGVMQETLRNWGYSPSDRPSEAMGWMGMPGPVESMPGWVTEEQIDQMSQARGAEADALFLDLLAEHHRGGLHMAEYASREADDGGVRELATRMAHNQAQEINEYRMTARRHGYDITIEPSDVPAPVPS
jgi:uncharacterized protein (DUF305 family)